VLSNTASSNILERRKAMPGLLLSAKPLLSITIAGFSRNYQESGLYPEFISRGSQGSYPRTDLKKKTP
jgi:hypothetical protein